jgi:hypothetical protein
MMFSFKCCFAYQCWRLRIKNVGTCRWKLAWIATGWALQKKTINLCSQIKYQVKKCRVTDELTSVGDVDDGALLGGTDGDFVGCVVGSDVGTLVVGD